MTISYQVNADLTLTFNVHFGNVTTKLDHYTLFFISNTYFYKQRQAEVGKKSSKC